MSVIVGNQTKISDLQTQLLDGSRIKDTVRGFKDKDGSIVLYTKPSHTGLRGAFEHMTSFKSRALAREGLRKIFDNHVRDSGSAMTSTVRTAVNKSFANGIMVGALSLIAEAAKGVRAAAAQETFEGASLASLDVPSSTLADGAKQAARSPTKEAAVQLGLQLGRAVMAGTPDAAARDRFTLATGRTFKAEVKAALDSEGHVASDEFLDDAFEAACSIVGRNQMDEKGQLLIGGETYAKAGHLGAGGGGTVDEYVNIRDPSDRIAFKTPRSVDEDAQFALLGEVKHHADAEGAGHPNVLGSKGGVRLPDGKFGYAMQVCPFGDMDEGFKFLNDAAAAGTITAEEALDAKITLFHDAMQGMAHVEKGQIGHGDLKPANFFIGADGSAKVADFGTAVTAKNYRWQEQGNLSPYYAAPEVFDAGEDKKRVTAELTRIPQNHKGRFKAEEGFTSHKISPMRAAADEVLRKQLPNLSTHDRNALLSEHLEAFKETTLASTLRMDGRDAYAMGATAYNVLHGKAPGEEGAFAFKFYAQLRADPTKPMISESPTTAVGSTGPVSQGFLDKAALLADLVNEMAMPELSSRRGIQSGLDHDVFKSSGVGSSRSRDVIKDAIKLGREAAAARKATAPAPQVDDATTQADASGAAKPTDQALRVAAEAEKAAVDVAS